MDSRHGASLGLRVIKRVFDVAWIVLVAGSVLATATVVAAVAAGANVRVSFPVTFSVHGGIKLVGSAGHASVSQAGGRLNVQPPRGLAAEAAAFVVLIVGFGLAVIYQLRALVTDVVSGTPFGTRSAQRVRLVGVAILAVEVLRCSLVLVGSLWARSHVRDTGLAFRASFPLNVEVLALGLLVVLLAEVFRHGAALQTDHDLTI